MNAYRLTIYAVCLLVAGLVTAGAWWYAMPSSTVQAENVTALDQPIEPAFHARLQVVSQKGLTAVPDFDSVPLKAIEETASTTPKQSRLVLYVGAGFCPYCAALRWPLAIAMLRFGDLRGLRYARSSANDVYPDTATLSFRDAHFLSALFRFEGVELSDRNRQPLMKLTSAQQALLMKFDQKPYTRYPGSIPFLYVGGRYLEIGSPFIPTSLQGLDWNQIVEQLEHGPGNETWQDIMAEADLLTAAFCTLTQGKPEKVCGAPAIVAAAGHLPH